MSEKISENNNRKKIFILIFIIVMLAVLGSGIWWYTLTQQSGLPEEVACTTPDYPTQINPDQTIEYSNRTYHFILTDEEQLQIHVLRTDDCDRLVLDSSITLENVKNVPDDKKNTILDKVLTLYENSPELLDGLVTSNNVQMSSDNDGLDIYYTINNTSVSIQPVFDDISNRRLFLDGQQVESTTVFTHGVQQAEDPQYVFFLTINLFEPIDRIAINGNVNPGFYRLDINTGEVENINTQAEAEYFSRIYANAKNVFVSRSNYIDVYTLDGGFVQSVDMRKIFNVEPPKGVVPIISYVDNSAITVNRLERFRTSSEFVILSIDELLR